MNDVRQLETSRASPYFNLAPERHPEGEQFEKIVAVRRTKVRCVAGGSVELKASCMKTWIDIEGFDRQSAIPTLNQGMPAVIVLVAFTE